MAKKRDKPAVSGEVELRWQQFLWLYLAVFLFFIILVVPFLAVLFAIACYIAIIALTVAVMHFMKLCEVELFPDEKEKTPEV